MKVYELYMSECCGVAVFPGSTRSDDIVEVDHEFYEAKRDGYCPACGAKSPYLTFIHRFEKKPVVPMTVIDVIEDE